MWWLIVLGSIVVACFAIAVGYSIYQGNHENLWWQIVATLVGVFAIFGGIFADEIKAVFAHEPTASSKNETVGSIITFGGHEWIVLESNDTKQLIITKDCVDQRAFGHSSDHTWEGSELQSYLNGKWLEAFKSKLSSKDSARIITGDNIPTASNPWFDTVGGGTTQDTVFLLSLSELTDYWGNNAALMTRSVDGIEYWYWNQLTEEKDKIYYKSNTYIQFADSKGTVGFSDGFEKDRIANYEKTPCWWWLRTPGIEPGYIAGVNANGTVDVYGHKVDNKNGGVRPAMWLKAR